MSAVPKSLPMPLKHTSCYYDSCDAIIIMPAGIYNDFRESGDFWYCYRGHRQHFVTGETEEAKLKRQLEAANTLASRVQKEKEWKEVELQHEKNSNRTLKGHITRVKNRVKAGLCPCCNRSFEDLGRHMKGQHPEYGNE